MASSSQAKTDWKVYLGKLKPVGRAYLQFRTFSKINRILTCVREMHHEPPQECMLVYLASLNKPLVVSYLA